MSALATWPDIGLLAGRLAILPMFVVSIGDKIAAPQGEIDQIRALGLPWPKFVERAVGVFEAVCVIAIATGIGARSGAAGLAAFTFVVNLLVLRYWKMPAGDTTTLTRTLFFNNLSAVGGLIVLAVAGPGRLVRRSTHERKPATRRECRRWPRTLDGFRRTRICSATRRRYATQ